jgi:hypothetical protein
MSSIFWITVASLCWLSADNNDADFAIVSKFLHFIIQSRKYTILLVLATAICIAYAVLQVKIRKTTQLLSDSVKAVIDVSFIAIMLILIILVIL